MKDFTPFFSAFGAINSVLFGIALLSISKKKNSGQWILGTLFLILALRLGKKALYTFVDDSYHGLIFNLMYLSALSLGPILLLYTRQVIKNHKINFSYILHFFPALAMSFIAYDWRPTMAENIWILIYIASLLHLLVYVALIQYNLRHNQQVSGEKKKWLLTLSLGFSLVSLSYLAEYFFYLPAYLVTALVYIVVVYAMFSLGLKQKFGVLLGKEKYGNTKLASNTAAHFKGKLSQLMTSQQPYLRPDLTMPQLAEMIGATPHLTSQLLNNFIGEGFPEYINRHRIGYASELLRQTPQLKISDIATDSGFNSLSAFNVAFRKQTGQTPSQFRDGLVAATPNPAI